MRRNALTLAVIVTIAMLGASGFAVADHDGGEGCDQLENAQDAIDEHAEDNNAVDRAQDECNGDHHQDEANDGGDNSERADDRS